MESINKKSWLCLLIIGAYLLFIPAMPILGQTSKGEIDITVSDKSGAVIPNANIGVVDSETGAAVRRLGTNASGLAAVTLLNPGTYNLTVKKNGFTTLVRNGIVVQVGEVLALPLTLQVGMTNQTVTVVGQTPLVNTVTNSQGQVIGNATTQALPLNGRNYLQLALLTAGTAPSMNKDTSFSVYGLRGLQNTYLLDGGLNEANIRGLDSHQRDAMRPSIDAVQEFNVQTSNYSAEYGGSAGGVVNVVTKSGTNHIHGSAFDFLRNSALDARDYFAPPGPTPLLIYNQFGGSMGGPLIKNRAWLFGAYQGTKIEGHAPSLSTVPTVAEKNGIFSQPIYDPYTTTGTGSTAVRTLFPNNTIPSTMFDPIGAKLASLYPDPNLPGTANNFAYNGLRTTSWKNATFRGDVQLTSMDSMFARYSFRRSSIVGQPALPEPADTPVNESIPSSSVGYGYTHIFSPTLVNNVRFSWNRTGLSKEDTLALDPIVPNSIAPGIDSGIPHFGVTGYAGLGQEPAGMTNAPLAKSSAVWDFADNATKNMGTHNLKFGGDFQYLKFTTLAPGTGRGSFTFNGAYTQNPQSRSGTGSGVADLLLGLANNLTTGTITDSNQREQNAAWYVQDSWRATQRLTLNFGVRYELFFPTIETHNKMADFILDPSDPAYGTLVFAGVDGRSRSLMTMDKNNISPRFGFAYRVPFSHDLVLRGGYGVFHGSPDEGIGVNGMMTNNPPFVGLGGQNIVGDQVDPSTAFSLSNDTLPPLALPASTSEGFVFDPTSTAALRAWPAYFKSPLVQEWNLSVQKQFANSILWEINYVGNISTGNWSSYPGNQPLTPGPGSVTKRRALYQYTHAPISVYAPWDRSHYEGLTTRIEKRMGGGVYFLTAFTYGKAMDLSSGQTLGGYTAGNAESVQDAYNLDAQMGPTDSDVRRRLVFSGIWDLPFGHGQRFLTGGLASYIAGNWQASGIWTASDGSPYTVRLSFNNANVGNVSWPDRICSGRLDNPTVHQFFDASCFPAPPPYTYGNSGRNGLVGPGIDNVDFALHRTFPIPLREGLRLEFRGEFFNFFNRTELFFPNGTLGVKATGTISKTNPNIPNREIQLALKVLW